MSVSCCASLTLPLAGAVVSIASDCCLDSAAGTGDTAVLEGVAGLTRAMGDIIGGYMGADTASTDTEARTRQEGMKALLYHIKLLVMLLLMLLLPLSLTLLLLM